MDRVVCLLGHSVVGRFSRRAVQRGQSVAQAAGVANVCEVHTHYSGGGTFARLLARPGPLLDRLRAIPQLDILVIDLGTNDLCPEDAAVSSVVGEALKLRCHHQLPQQVVFLTVVLRTSRGCRRGVPATTFNHRAKAFNTRLATRSLGSAAVYSQVRLKSTRFLSMPVAT